MIQTTIQAMHMARVDTRGHELYLYRDGVTVFYVGQSNNPYTRFLKHINIEASASTGGSRRLGQLISDHAPLSLFWQIELFRLEECDLFVSQCRPGEYEQFQKHKNHEWRQPAIDAAERALIAFCCPCFNVGSNFAPTPLPEKYAKTIHREKRFWWYIEGLRLPITMDDLISHRQ